MSLKPLLAAGLLAATLLPLQAGNFTNLGNSRDGNYLVGQIADFGGHDLAVSFTAGSYATLNAVSLAMGGSNADQAGFAVSLYSSTSGKPGTSLATLAGSDDPVGPDTYTYTDSAATLLSPGTTYWIVASAPHNSNSSFYSWSQTDDLTATAEPGWASTGYAINDFDAAGNPAGWNVLTDRRFRFSVDATAAVPEPTTYALAAGLALLGFAVWRKR